MNQPDASVSQTGRCPANTLRFPTTGPTTTNSTATTTFQR